MADRTTQVNLEDSTEVIINPATEGTLKAVSGLVTSAYDSVTVNYTTAAKTVIDTIIYKSGVTTVATITATYPSATQEIYTKT